MADQIPNSFKDPYWSNLADQTTNKLGLPDGVLKSILLNGERTNADLVSPAGAKTPFQIIPSTRDAALKKYGIDAYLSPQNAAEVAGLLVKESLGRNANSIAKAVAEYHGGTNPENHGKITRDYVARVMGGMQQRQPSELNAFEKAMGSGAFKNLNQGQSEGSISSIYSAYKSGKMSEQDVAEFESDVQNGLIMLPRGAKLRDTATTVSPKATNAVELPKSVIDAYNNGEMTVQQMMELESDVKSGLAIAPSGFSPKSTQKPGIIESVINAATGSERETFQTKSLPDWAAMPELNSLSLASFKSALGTMASSPDETVQVIKANFPNVQVSQDNKGNYILQSSIDKKQYVIKPGFRVSDIPRAIGQVAATAPFIGASIPGAIAAGAAGQAAIEASQAATGGTFNPSDVAIAGALGGALPAAVRAVKGVPATISSAQNSIGGAIDSVKRGALNAIDSVTGVTRPPSAQSAGTGASIGAAGTDLELQRATQAEMAGLKLTEGETKRSPELLAWEKEKAKTPEYQSQFLERDRANNLAALQKFEQWTDDTGATTFNPSDTGIKVIDALMSGWNAEKKKTSEMYNTFRSSKEASLPVNHSKILDFLNEQPVGVAGITGVTDVARQNAIRLGIASLDDSGRLTPLNTTLGKLEEFRQSVSAINPSSPNDKRLISVIKRGIDDAGHDVGGNLTKAMRAQRQRQAQKYENRAIIANLLTEKRGMSDPKIPIEDVFNKTILNARPSEIQHVKRVLLASKQPDAAQAWDELRGATIRHILDSGQSGKGADNLPVISSSKLDKAVSAMDKNGKLDLVLGKELGEQVRNINEVLKYIQSVPPGTSINNSGTARTVFSLLAESAAFGKTTGIPLPIAQGVKILRDSIRDKRIKSYITATLNYKPKGKL